MTDSESASIPVEKLDHAVQDSAQALALADLIERALLRELAVRRELRPHAQLGVAPNASLEIIDAAYLRLQSRYRADAFAEHGDAAVAAAAGIVALMRDAYQRLRRFSALDAPPELPSLDAAPRADDTLRALAILRGAIARRLAEAEAHRDAGRIADAIRLLESVMILDRHNVVARQALTELRRHRDVKAPTALARLWARVLGRDAPPAAVEP